VLLPFGLSLVSLKTGLFVVGWLAFGVVAIRLFRGTVTTQTTAELSGFDRTLLRVPPLCLYWNEDTTPARGRLSASLAQRLASSQSLPPSNLVSALEPKQ